ncbi:MAG TPA: glycerol-3-phosphate acyltransferase [Anaerolineae bacterium]|nr:glycerol-3-phosphate acyltransferase [Anaerolineae bacterium]
MQILHYVLVTLLGYLVGSFSNGYVVSRWWKGIDPREYASGRTGGTNVLRSAGLGPAVVTAVGDILKGVLAVVLARLLVGTDTAEVLAGLAAVLGHNHSIFLGFKGGAGTSANIGVLFGLAPHIVPFVAIAVVVVGLGARMASLASIAGGVTMVVAFAVSFFLSRSPVIHVVYGVLACAMILFELRPNIARLRAGTERRVDHL